MTALETLVNHYATPLSPDVEGVYYFASPYTSDDLAQTQEWVQEMRDLKPRIINAYPKIVPLVPVLETDPLAETCEPEGGWYAFGLTLLNTAEGLIVVQQDGWQHSRGIMLEFGFARGKGLPIATLDPNSIDTDFGSVGNTGTDSTPFYTEADIVKQMENLKKADASYADLSPEKLRARAIEILEDDIPF